MGYVLKAQSTADLLVAIRTVASGRLYVAPEVAAKLPPPSAGGPIDARHGQPGLEALSRREREIFRHADRRNAAAEIARRLSISPKTVEFHRTNINRKLAVRTTADLVRFAVAHGILLAPRALDAPEARSDVTAI